MRKGILFSLIFAGLFFCTITSQAQELGLRFGHINGNNVAVDGIFSTGKYSRVHANVSFGNNGLGLDALWNPIYDEIPDIHNPMIIAGFGRFGQIIARIAHLQHQSFTAIDSR